MDDDADDTVVSLTDHKAKLERQEVDDNKTTTLTANPNISEDVIEDLNACLQPGDMEAVLRVFTVLRSTGDEVNIRIDHSDIYINVTNEQHEAIDAGVDFPEQVIKSAATTQTSTINFDYKEEEWDSMENFFYHVGFALRRCIESLTYWSTGKDDD